jgi:cell division septal protein FtsQ
MSRRRQPLLVARGHKNRRIDPDLREARKRISRTGVRAAAAVVLVVGAGYHGHRLADSRGWLDLFKIREVRVVGVRVANPSVLVAEAGLKGADVHFWSPMGVYAERARRDPLVADVRIRRSLPNRLTLQVTEREPVALLRLDRLAPVDSGGRILPVSAFHAAWDAPILTVDWPSGLVAREGKVRLEPVLAMVRYLGEIKRRYPALAREISAVELANTGEATLRLIHAEGEIVLDTQTPVEKLTLVDDVLRDLRAKGQPYVKLDLRFTDQIVVRRG